MADTFVNVTWVADELVTSTKLNQAMANQSNFHNGTALGDGIIVTRHLGNGQISNAKINWDTFFEKATLSYNSGWINFEEVHSVACFKVGKTVFLSGLFGRTTNIAGGQTILTLPAGYRPSATKYNATSLIFQTAASQSTANGTVSINTDGLLVSRVAVNAGQWVSVSGMTFVTD